MVKLTKEDENKLGQILKGLNDIKNDLEKGKARKLQMLGYAKRHQDKEQKKGGEGSGKKGHQTPKKEIREDDGTLVITDKDAPAGMGRTQEWQDDE